jgi:hypothetical protein
VRVEPLGERAQEHGHGEKGPRDLDEREPLGMMARDGGHGVGYDAPFWARASRAGMSTVSARGKSLGVGSA